MKGSQIRAWRKRIGWSQARLADALSHGRDRVHPMTVSKWERDESKPPPYLRLALAWLEEHPPGE